MTIYTDDADRQTFLTLLGQVADVHDLVCHAYCLMTNHYHLVATTPSANLSRAVKQLNGPYAQWWNRRHGHVGHVFQGRFYAQIVQNDAYLITVCRYVTMNPVRAGLVGRARDWPWSSYRASVGLAAPPPFLTSLPPVEWLEGDSAQAWTCRTRTPAATDGPLPAKLPADPVLGDPDFVEQFKAVRLRAGPEVARRERLVRPPLDEVFARAVTKAARNSQSARAYRLGYSMAAIARHLGIHHSTVSRMIRAAGDNSGARP